MSMYSTHSTCADTSRVTRNSSPPTFAHKRSVQKRNSKQVGQPIGDSHKRHEKQNNEKTVLGSSDSESESGSGRPMKNIPPHRNRVEAIVRETAEEGEGGREEAD